MSVECFHLVRVKSAFLTRIFLKKCNKMVHFDVKSVSKNTDEIRMLLLNVIK